MVIVDLIFYVEIYANFARCHNRSYIQTQDNHLTALSYDM